MPLPTGYNRQGLIQPPFRLSRPDGGRYVAAGTLYELAPAVIVKQTFTDASTIDTDGVSASHAGAASAGTTAMPIDGALTSGGVATLSPARNVVITVTHASSVVAMSGVITGTRLGQTVTEDWSVTATGTSKTFTGAVAFDTITGITEVIAADASTNTIIAGNGKVLGVVFKASNTKLICETQDGAVVTNGTLVAASASANADDRGTYSPNGTLNGALDFSIWYIVDDLDNII